MQEIITTSYDSMPDGTNILSVKINDETIRKETTPLVGARSEAFCLYMVLSSLSPGRNFTIVCRSTDLFNEMTDPAYISDDVYIEQLRKASRTHIIRWVLKQEQNV